MGIFSGMGQRLTNDFVDMGTDEAATVGSLLPTEDQVAGCLIFIDDVWRAFRRSLRGSGREPADRDVPHRVDADAQEWGAY